MEVRKYLIFGYFLGVGFPLDTALVGEYIRLF